MKRFLASFFLVFSFFLEASNDLTQNYLYELKLEEERFSRSLELKKTSSGMEIRAFDEESGRERILLGPSGEFLESQYELPSGERVEVKRDPSQKKFLLTKGKAKKDYKERPDTYPAGSFYHHSSCPGRGLGQGESLVFTMIQSKDLAKRKMRFTYKGEVQVKLGGQTLTVKKYEMKLVNFLEALFWPHTYHFWYDSESGIIVHYEGLEPNKKLKTITLIETT